MPVKIFVLGFLLIIIILCPKTTRIFLETMTITATLYPVGAPEGEVHIDRNTSLAQMQGMVGGNIQMLPSKDRKQTLILNEEGLLLSLPENHHEAVKKAWYTKEEGAFPLLGNVIIINTPMSKLDL